MTTARPDSAPCRLFLGPLDDRTHQHGREQLVPVVFQFDAALLDKINKNRKCVCYVWLSGRRELDPAGREPDGKHGAERVRRSGRQQPEHLRSGDRRFRQRIGCFDTSRAELTPDRDADANNAAPSRHRRLPPAAPMRPHWPSNQECGRFTQAEFWREDSRTPEMKRTPATPSFTFGTSSDEGAGARPAFRAAICSAKSA
jgi:hypothetical protein